MSPASPRGDGGKPARSLPAARRLLALLRPYRWRFALGMATAFLASLLDGFTIVVLIPLLKHLFGTAGALADRAGSTRLEALIERLLEPLLVGASAGEAAWRIVAVLVAGLVVKNGMSYAYSQIVVGIQEGLVRDLRSRLFAHLLTLDAGFFQRTRVGQLIAGVISDVDQTKTAVTAALASFFQNLTVIVITLAVLSQISWRLTLLTVATAPILVIGIQTLLRRLRRHSRARADERGEITSTVTERLGAVKLIRAYGREADEARRFLDQAQRYRKRVIRTQRFSSLTSPVSEIFGGLVVILLIWAGTVPALHGGRPPSPEALIVFLALALRMMSPVKSMSQFPAAMAVALASAERVFAILDTPSSEVDPPDAREARFEREIVFDRVSFTYDDGTAVLRDVSFAVPKGRVVAIVGPSGAGKTTLVDLLPRFHDPTAGRILLDGVPLDRFTRRSLRGLLGVVSQETVILNDTVRANIAYGRPGATQAEIEQAAAAANAAEFIAQLPQGYDTMLGERGTRLSGGQRQRIAIARALLRDPPILILDEATSALDTESERLVQQAIERLMRDRTVLVIAHRLTTVRDADEILVLNEGRIVERGTHEELFRRGGLYRRLYDLQFRGEVALGV
ncbi:MAG TPA: ABC transporter ATP-binding protein [Gemmatimonadales bacterium]|nr:ABC transporter ATP-binding protein [Gemmatimonadales bacterium]